MPAATINVPPARTAEIANPGRIGLRTLILIRWIAVAGQAGALLFVEFVLGFNLPLLPCLAAIFLSAAINLFMMLALPRNLRLSDYSAALSLAYDLIQLTFLLYFTGGLRNPFAILLLAPVTVSAAALSYRATWILTILSCLLAGALAWIAPDVPWRDPHFTTSTVYLVALTCALIVTIGFISAYVFSVAEEGRRLSNALSATQSALEQERRVSALGALAAAAAHELGTPLSTIVLAAKEMQRDLPAGSPLREDLALILAEAARCRNILTELSRRPDPEQTPFLSFLPATALLETALRQYRRADIDIDLSVDGNEANDQKGYDEPVLPNRADIVHGLGLLLQNAIQFAARTVTLRVAASADQVRLLIADDGPGFSADILDWLGEPYRSGGAQGRSGSGFMGLGVFVAKTLLGHSGARIDFSNGLDGGARVTVTWPQRFTGAVMGKQES